LHAFDHAGYEGQRQSNNIEIAAVDARNPARGLTLDGIGSGFAVGFAGGDVGGEFVVGGREHGHVRDFGGDFGDGVRGGWGEERYASDDFMGGSGEEAQHAGCVFVVFGLGEDFSVGGDDGGVGSEDQGWFGLGEGFEDWGSGDGLGFFARETEDVADGGFVGAEVLGDFGGDDFEGVASLGEQVASSWGR